MRRISYLSQVSFVVFVSVFAASAVYGKVIHPPQQAINEAVVLAKQYVQEQKIDVSAYFIASAEYFNLHNEYEQPFWRIEYRLLAGAKGGQIIIFVYQDGTIKHGYGE